MVYILSQDENGRNLTLMECKLSTLGSDQVLAILVCLPVQSVIAFGLTCKRFRVIAESDDLWACICNREWGSRAVHAWPVLSKDRKGWKRVYRQMLMLKAASWRRVRQLDVGPAPRASHSMNSIAGKVTVFGGGCTGGQHLDDTWVASVPSGIPDSISWQQTSVGIPSGRFGQSCTVVENKLVLFGGINDKGTRQCDTWVNNGLGKETCQGSAGWELVEVATCPPSRGAHAGCYGGESKVVIFGGIGSEGVRLRDTWVLNLAEVPPSWHEVFTPLDVAPCARSGHSLTWIGGKKMVLFGGRGTRFEVLSDVWLLDMEESSPVWVELMACEFQSLHDWPTPRAGHSATLIFGGRILIFGGEDARRSRKADAWVLDPMAAVQAGRTSSSTASYPKKSQFGDKLAPRFWKKLKQCGQPPSKRCFHGACALESGHSILVFGGMVDADLLPASITGLGFDSELHMLQLIP